MVWRILHRKLTHPPRDERHATYHRSLTLDQVCSWLNVKDSSVALISFPVFSTYRRCLDRFDDHPRAEELASPRQPPPVGCHLPHSYTSPLSEGSSPGHVRLSSLAENIPSVCCNMVPVASDWEDRPAIRGHSSRTRKRIPPRLGCCEKCVTFLTNSY